MGDIPMRNPLARMEETTWDKLLRLDSTRRPGLPEKEFKALFTQCRCCHWIMTAETFQHHECALDVRWIIDLSGDE
jgi:hypothetical protein